MQTTMKSLFTIGTGIVALTATMQTSRAYQDVTITNNGQTITVKKHGSKTIIRDGKSVVTTNGTRRVTHSAVRRTGDSFAGAQITLNGNNLQRTYIGRGTDFVVNGNGNNLMLNGTYQQVTINGNRNTIRAASVGSIVTSGNNNQITWVRGISGRPNITNSGHGNGILRSR